MANACSALSSFVSEPSTSFRRALRASNSDESFLVKFFSSFRLRHSWLQSDLLFPKASSSFSSSAILRCRRSVSAFSSLLVGRFFQFIESSAEILELVPQTRTPARPSGRFKRAGGACKAALARAQTLPNQSTYLIHLSPAGASIATFRMRWMDGRYVSLQLLLRRPPAVGGVGATAVAGCWRSTGSHKMVET
ncbi:hypothetical protein EYF80_028779 [Liparis tanakae]|uniref:Uncharacterized protein n=1 Tax=Liparis tanakae TaxID=230148 RepID=A0A4Z2H5S9_9TELE|nr:hypothetical protein EYF80_028779 [Liparis tanakae]